MEPEAVWGAQRAAEKLLSSLLLLAGLCQPAEQIAGAGEQQAATGKAEGRLSVVDAAESGARARWFIPHLEMECKTSHQCYIEQERKKLNSCPASSLST